jgi:gamma-glutamyltranspeptidase/glutathione hydrolase
MRDGGVLNLESEFPPETLQALTAMGHTIRRTRGGYGGYQAILWDSVNGVYFGASESRKDGHAAGY